MDRIEGDLGFIVVNKKFLKQLSMEDQDTLNNILQKMDCHNNQYLVCNTDEVYADDIFEMILNGEFVKEYIKNNAKRIAEKKAFKFDPDDEYS